MACKLIYFGARYYVYYRCYLQLYLVRILLTLIVVFFLSCNDGPRSSNKPSNDSAQGIQDLEASFSDDTYDSLGKFISEISFALTTNDLKTFPDGRYPWIRIDSPDIDLPTLIDKDEIVIRETKVVLLIDYPLSEPYTTEILSSNGFSRKHLVNEISRNYYKVYAIEESTATVKTLPVAQRKTTYNRNRTNGKYGIWGHDIGDLALTGMRLYKSSTGIITLVLEVDS
jgi:hypothetical protein